MSRKAILALFAPIVIVMLIVDRLSKAWAADNLSPSAYVNDLGLVDFTLVHNRGAAFGMGQGGGAVFVIMAIVIVAAILAWLLIAKDHNRVEVVALALVAAGGIGNLIDRVTTVYVVDFLHFTFIDFPVFNVADICVTCGVILFVLVMVVTTFAGGDRDKGKGEAS